MGSYTYQSFLNALSHGVVVTPDEEKEAVDMLLESDTLTPTQRRCLYRRRRKAQERTSNARYLVAGNKPGKLPTEQANLVRTLDILKSIAKSTP